MCQLFYVGTRRVYTLCVCSHYVRHLHNHSNWSDLTLVQVGRAWAFRLRPWWWQTRPLSSSSWTTPPLSGSSRCSPTIWASLRWSRIRSWLSLLTVTIWPGDSTLKQRLAFLPIRTPHELHVCALLPSHPSHLIITPPPHPDPRCLNANEY